jgi:hypothetical protein
MGDGARSSNVAGLVSEGSYDIALRVTGQHWRPALFLEAAPLTKTRRDRALQRLA